MVNTQIDRPKSARNSKSRKIETLNNLFVDGYGTPNYPQNNSTRLGLFILEIPWIIYNCVAPSSGFNRRTNCIDFSRLYAFISIDSRFHKRNGGNAVELWIVERRLLTLFTPFMRVSVHAVRECQLTQFMVRSTYVDAELHRQLFRRAERSWRRRSNVQILDACVLESRRRPPPYGLTNPSHSASSSRFSSRKTYTHRSSASTNANMSALDL
jgi:hypothetical protein